MENQVVVVMQREKESEEPSNARGRRDRIIKQKMVDVDRTLSVTLGVRIDRLEMYDKGGSLLLRPFYLVAYWVETEHQRVSKLVRGSKHICVNEVGSIWLSYNHYKYLYVEVMRMGPTSDPGTSYGMTLVGRARIPLPPKDDARVSGIYELMRRRREDGEIKAQGLIQLTLKRSPDKEAN